MSTTELDDLANTFGGPQIPDQDTADPRYPFVFLIDTSTSTGMVPPTGSEPDIVKINNAMNTLFLKLKHPAPGDPLALSHHQVDIAVVTYSDNPNIQQKWVAAPDLPVSPPLFVPHGGTSTGMGLMTALDVALGRLQRYKKQGLPKCGIPHIFHLTDGEANDVKMGDAKWQMIENKIKALCPDPESRQAVIWHFVAPNGYIPSPYAPVDANGTPQSGAVFLSKWFGQDNVIPLSDGADNFERLIQLFVKTITAVSQQAASAKTVLKDMGGRSYADEAHA